MIFLGYPSERMQAAESQENSRKHIHSSRSESPKESSRRVKLEQWCRLPESSGGKKRRKRGWKEKNGRGGGREGEGKRGERKGEEIWKLEATLDMLSQNLWHGTWRFSSFKSSLGDSSELVRLGNL